MEETSSAEGTRQTPLTRALATIRTLRERLDEQEGNQPVAVVGIGLRLPGGIEDLDGYWDALAAGRDLVRPLPQHRKGPFADDWEGLPQRGGFLDEVLDFDAAFFGISPREARHLDPQQRLLLEVAWEALENAGLPAEKVSGSQTGFYLGIMWEDYREWLEGEPDAYWTTGNGHNFAAGRIAYALGLTGPAVAVDTACSSSLVAVHLAVQALRRGECETAFAAGTNLIMSPRSMRLVQETRSLAPDGLCKTFDARANGFTRGEGCGVVVLKRLDHALRDGDRVHAVIHGTAVNQDGRSGGFTAPNVLSQAAVIGKALDDAGLTPSDIGYVEAHGTGTSLGDPIEMEALAISLGRRNGGAPLPVGAVKTNLGHLESAAGIAGLVKAVLCLKHRRIPPLVHFRTLNPRIDLTGTGITVPSELQEWAPGNGTHAGVSSFGMSGTNAHVVLGPPEIPAAASPPGTPPDGFEISAKTDEALRELARRYADRAERLDPADYPAFAYTADSGRSRHEIRARVAATGPRSAAEALRAIAAGAVSPDAVPAAPEPAGAAPRRIIDLPAYPWQRQHYAPERLPAPAPVFRDAPRPVAYRLDWVPAALRHTETATAGTDGPAPTGGGHGTIAGMSPGTALVLAGDDTRTLERLAVESAAMGMRGTLLAPAPLNAPPGWEYGALPAGAAGWDRFWADGASPGNSTLLLVMRSVPLPEDAGSGGDPAADGAALCAAVTTAASALARAGRGRAFVVTRAVRRLTDDDRTPATGDGLVHGLAPVLGLELTAAWGGVVDLAREAGGDDLRALLAFVARQGATAGTEELEDLAAVRDGVVRVARLVPAADHTPDLTVRADASYAVTGALGGVGRELVDDLVRRGARHLLLIGRRPEPELGPDAAALLDRLDREGVTVVYRGGGCDTPEALTAALSALAGMPPLRGVVHAAGSLRRSPAADMSTEDFAEQLRGKHAGAWWLHLATREQPLDFFVLVSSVSALLGTEGYAAYSAANGALDALAAHRVSLGLPAVSIAYGPWDLGGEGMADAALRERSARTGVGALDAAAGRAALTDRAPGTDGLVLACALDRDRLRQVMAALRPRGLFATAEAPVGSADPVEPSVVTELAELTERARPEAARAHVARMLADQLGYASGDELRQDTGFFDLGLDSIAAVDLAVRLSTAFGVPVQVADVFDHPTIVALAGHLLEASSLPAAVARIPSQRPAPAAPGEAADGPTVPQGPAVPRPAVQSSAAVRSPAPAAVPERSNEPIAVIGMAGRFPQADSVEELWSLLSEGRDGITPVPEGRWDEASVGEARITTLQGGFLRDLDRFDAAFFSIPAREAENLDPQQRLLLESAWHALEDGGIDPGRLRGSRTGVFVGISYADYARLLAQGGAEHIDAYYSTGTALNAAAGRIAYSLGLNGPAVAVDTACSSSLVAIHLAVRSLRSGETDAVLAGGVNVLLDPMSWVAVSQAHMLSPDGRCRTFSADANGFARSEGCGVLVLKRLSDARRDGDRVLAVIRGSAVNQDGPSSGLTVPSGRAQEAMIAAALADAGTDAAEVSYLEAHGTGTSLGDPIELRAAWRALSPGRRPGEPLRVGSVKSNIGHCESAAGMAAVIKTVLALRHELIPANLHFGTPNPHVAWPEMNLRVVDSAVPWRRGERSRVAGVSGFGFSGTNAHLVLADAPDPIPDAVPAPIPEAEPSSAAPRPVTHLVPLSAPDPEGLERLTEAWRQRLEDCPEEELPPLAVTAGAGRAHFPYRRALFGRTREHLLASLRDAPAPEERNRAPRVAFLFTGQGSQYVGMGRELYETEPVFREVFDTCDRALEPALGASLAELMYYGSDREAINETRITQPALVTLETALAALWQSWGVRPAVVLGHSVGEIAAALHAGVMDLPTGLRLIADRARLMQDTERGAMLAVAAPEAQVLEWTEGTGLDLAAVNGPEATVVSGRPERVDALQARLKQQGVRCRRLTVSHAFHSSLMEPALDAFSAALAPLDFRDPDIPLVSNLTGRLAEPGAYDADYWIRHTRRPVRFLDGLRQLGTLDVDLCLEIGPDRTLVNLVNGAGLTPVGGTASSLRRGTSDRAGLLAAVRTLYLAGQDIDWARVHRTRTGSPDTAPRYPFARTRHWTRAPRSTGTAAARGAVPATGPAWGTELHSPALRGRVWVTERSTEFPAHLDDHRLYGTVSVPGASQTATVLSALGRGGVPVALQDLHFPRALVLHDGERYELQIVETEQDHGGRTVGVHSLIDPELGRWQEHLAARVLPADQATAVPAPDPGEFTAGAERHLSGADFYRHLRTLGYHLGPSFRWIGDAWIRGDEALIRYTEPEGMSEDPADYEIHPGLLDSCLQSAVAFAVDPSGSAAVEEEPALAIPFALSKVSFPGRPAAGAALWGHIRALRHDRRDDGLMQVESADLHLFDDSGRTVLAVEDFRFRRAPRSLLERSLRDGLGHAFELTWRGRPPAPAVAAPAEALRIALVGGDGVTGRALRAALEALGHQPVEDGSNAHLIVDARFAEEADAAETDTAKAALTAALTLAGSLREYGHRIPYAVLARDGARHAPVRETLWGMLASVAAEQHDRRLLRITLTDDWRPSTLARALGESVHEGVPETRLEVGAETVRVARLTPCGPDDGDPVTVVGGAALVTGGLGALGLSAAGFLARRGATSITLMARSVPDARARATIDELTAKGVRIRVYQGDVTDPDACRGAVVEAGRDAPLRTVLHLAGAADDHAFDHLTPAAFDTVFAAKARGAVELVAALEGQELAALVFFSSASSVLGSAGQANYAAANGFLGGLACRLRAEAVPATSIDWGPWIPRRKGGMADSAATGQAIDRIGLRPLDDTEAEELLRTAMAGDRPRLVAVAVDPERYTTRLAGHPRAVLFQDLVVRHSTAAGSAAGPSPARGRLREALADLAPEARDERLRESLRELVAETVGEDREAFDDDLGFAEGGLDSIMIIDLRTRLSEALAVDLPATVALDHPTVARLAAHVLDRLFRADTGMDPDTGPGTGPAPDPGPVPDRNTDTSSATGPGTRTAPDRAPDRAPAAEPEEVGELAGLSFDELLQAVQADVTAEK